MPSSIQLPPESTEDHYRVADDPPRGTLALEVVGVIAIYQQLPELAQIELGESFRLPD